MVSKRQSGELIDKILQQSKIRQIQKNLSSKFCQYNLRNMCAFSSNSRGAMRQCDPANVVRGLFDPKSRRNLSAGQLP